jgi:hypothetical protein
MDVNDFNSNFGGLELECRGGYAGVGFCLTENFSFEWRCSVLKYTAADSLAMDAHSKFYCSKGEMYNLSSLVRDGGTSCFV